MSKRNLIFTVFMALLLSACLKEEGVIAPSAPATGFTLNYIVEGTSINTYASIPAEPGEDEIKDLYVLFFENSTTGSGRFIEAYDASAGCPLKTSGSIEVDFPHGSNLSKTKAYNLLVVANLGDYLNQYSGGAYTDVNDWFSYLSSTYKNETEVINETNIIFSGPSGNSEADDSHIIEPTNILMSARVQRTEGQEHVNITLIRVISRFDVNLIAEGFTLQSVSIWNAFPSASIWESSFNNFAGTNRIERFYGVKNVTGNKVKGGLYAPENYVTVPQQNDDKTTCLILGINNGSATTYYRVNIHAPNMAQQLKRNNVYQLTVTKVNGPGENSEEEAYNSPDLYLDLQINGWNVDDQGMIQYDGDNVLAIPTKNIIFTPAAETREYNIFTLGTGTLYMSKAELPSGITASLNGKLLTVSATASQNDKHGYIELQFGSLKAVINVSQTGQTTEFLNLSSYTIPAFPAQGGHQQAGNIVVTSSGPWTAKIYNNQNPAAFTFQGGINLDQITGTSGATFSISTASENVNSSMRYAFVMVTLDNNPEISRTIVLAQNGTGALSLSPTTPATFNVLGYPNYGYTYFVDCEGPWTAVLEGVNADRFAIITDQNSVTVNANGENIEPFTLSAALRVYKTASPTVRQIVNITQDVHSITTNPISIGTSIPTSGGSTVNITVASTGPWTAEVTTTGGQTATFNEGSATQISGSSGQSFTVTFPELTTPIVAPLATVKVYVTNAPEVFRTITVSQSSLLPNTVSFRSHSRYYGSFSVTSGDYYDRFNQFLDNLKSSNNFGPSGTVNTYGNFIFNEGDTPSSDTKVFVVTAVHLTASTGSDIRNWLDADPSRVLFWVGDLGASHAAECLRLNTDGYEVNILNDHNTLRKVNYPASANKIMEYLLKTGPFTNGTEIDPNNIQLNCDGISMSISKYPALDFVPVINGQYGVILGIDPVRRIIFLGDYDIFGNRNNHNKNNDFSPNSANYKFMMNLQAWMINVAQYGDSFLNQFITP